MNEKNNKTSNLFHAKEPPMNNCTWEASVWKAMHQYDTAHKAKKFASKATGGQTDRREKRCIIKALASANIRRGATVLDVPCGSGRLLPLLKKMGYRVTGADISAAMLEHARLYAGPLGENCLDERDELQLTDIFRTGFSDNCFEAVVCNRLLHYFPEPQIRQRALKELRRICSGPIVVSFLCTLALDEATSCASDRIRARKPHGCRAISCTTFANDARQAGLVVKKWIPIRPLISRRWYAVLERDDASDNRTANEPNSILWPKLAGKLGRVAAVAAVTLIAFFISPYSKAITDPHEYKIEQIVKEYQDGDDHFYVSANPHLEDLYTGKNLSIISDITEAPEKIATDRTQLEDSFFLILYKDLNQIKKTTAWNQLSLIRMVNVCGEKFVLLSTEISNTSIKLKTLQIRFLKLREVRLYT